MSESDPFNELLARAKVFEAHGERVQELVTKSSEASEQATLMQLWSDLGDHTETYWQAMQAVNRFVEAKKSAVKEVNNITSTRLKARVLKALAECLLAEVTTLEQLAELEDERDRKLAALS